MNPNTAENKKDFTLYYNIVIPRDYVLVWTG